MTILFHINIATDFSTRLVASTVARLFLGIGGLGVDSYRVYSTQSLEPSRLGIEFGDQSAYPTTFGDVGGKGSSQTCGS